MSIDSSKPTNPKVSPVDVVLAVIVGIVALFGSQAILGIILGIYIRLRHWSVAQGNNWLNNSVLLQFFFVLVAGIMTIATVYYFLKLKKVKLPTIGLRKPKWSDPLFGLIGLPVYIIIHIILVAVAVKIAPHLNLNEKQQIGFDGVHGLFDIVLTFMSLVVLPPISEEIIFRGLIYTNLRKKMSMWIAAIITSLLFAVAHLQEGGSAGLFYVGAIDTFSLSLVLVFLREKTGGLYASMTLHGLKNLVAFITLLAMNQL